MTKKITRLQPVNLREVWAKEPECFTPWMAKEENLSILADALNINLQFVEKEKNIGLFRADILCRNTDDSSWVLVENQLNRADHKHLGQVLTYATGLKAATIVWVAAEFAEEHRETLSWLNEITDDLYQFFGVEVKVWTIEDSAYGVEFNVVSSPKDWASPVIDDDDSDWRTRFWSRFREHLLEQTSKFKIRKSSEKTFVGFGIGRPEFRLYATLSPQKAQIGIRLRMRGPNATAHFHLLEEQAVEIEQEFDTSLEWNELPGKKSCRVSLDKKDTNPTDEADWPNQHAWLTEKLELFDRVFRHRVQALNADDWPSEDEGDE